MDLISCSCLKRNDDISAGDSVDKPPQGESYHDSGECGVAHHCRCAAHHCCYRYLLLQTSPPHSRLH